MCIRDSNTINSTAQTYIDEFFSDDDGMEVELQPFKENSKTGEISHRINTIVNYKNMEDRTISSLSGGEKQRIALAFTLALAELQQVPFLLLDECTSNLDEEMTSIIIHYIKKNFECNLVILIAHQVVTGSFDKVIEIE